jgi:hypothetical protein
LFVPLGGVLAITLIVFAFMPSDDGLQDVALSFDGLPHLEGGFYYEGWAVIDGEAWSTGQFNVAEDGSLVTRDGDAVDGGVYEAGRDLTDAVMFAVTMHSPGDDRGPAAPQLLGDDFAGVAGVYTPTDSGGAEFSFRVPQLPPGWEYEAWAANDGAPTSLGRFGGAHDQHATHGHGSVAPEEVIVNHEVIYAGTDIRGATLTVTIESATDDATTPFGIRVLEARLRASVEAGVQYQVPQAPPRLATGHAVIQ